MWAETLQLKHFLYRYFPKEALVEAKNWRPTRRYESNEFSQCFNVVELSGRCFTMGGKNQRIVVGFELFFYGLEIVFGNFWKSHDGMLQLGLSAHGHQTIAVRSVWYYQALEIANKTKFSIDPVILAPLLIRTTGSGSTSNERCKWSFRRDGNAFA